MGPYIQPTKQKSNIHKSEEFSPEATFSPVDFNGEYQILMRIKIVLPSSPAAAGVDFTEYLRYSSTVNELKQVHSFLLKTVTDHHLHFCIKILNRLLQFPGDHLCYARHLFEQIPQCRNERIWTSLIRCYVFHGRFSRSISLYANMHREGVLPSGFTFSSVLNACAKIPAFWEGKLVHGRLVHSGFGRNKIVQTAVLDMYVKCGCVLDAREVFDKMTVKDVVAWTGMICGYTKMSMMDDAQRLFDIMGERNVVSWTAMVAGYANCGDMKAAKLLYDDMPVRNSVTWVAMIAGYGKCGDVIEARKVFDEIPMKDASCWAAMVACYSQNAYAKEAVEIFNEMRERRVKITEVALVGAISACTQLGDIEMATELPEHLDKGDCDRTVIVSNALIHMHAKFGSIDSAWREFNRMNERDVISYTSLITALANHGKAEEVLNLFSKMQNEGIKPNQVTFVGILNACSHAGLIEEGCKYFALMTPVFGIQPLAEHYACMVDLLGRAGQLEKAYNLIIDNVGAAADSFIWLALLGACKVHGNAELGELAAMHLAKMDPENTANYILLASTYASLNQWDEAERVRNIVNDKRMRKLPGQSWISSFG